MSFVVVAKFPCKPGQVEAMGELFKAANEWLEQRKALINGTSEPAA